MIKVMLIGAAGKMGRAVTESVKQQKNIEIACGFDVCGTADYPIFNDADSVNVPFDVIIDFSRPETLDTVICLARKHAVPVIIATTGYSDDERAKIDELSKSVPVFISGNMSIGINVMLELAKTAAGILKDADIELVEAHHNQKVDAPSGTALMIADAVNEARNNELEYTYGRSGGSCKRAGNELGIHSIRGGTVVGEHELKFLMGDEMLEIKHTSLSRGMLADGAIKAAFYIIGKKPGMYNMSDLISGK